MKPIEDIPFDQDYWRGYRLFYQFFDVLPAIEKQKLWCQNEEPNLRDLVNFNYYKFKAIGDNKGRINLADYLVDI